MPITVPVRVRSSPPAALAMPKSVTFTGPPRGTSTLAGFTSRCTRPARCAASSASATCLPMRMTSATGRPPRSSMRWRSVGPVDQLHHDVGDAVVVAGVVGGHDVGVRQAGRGDGLVAEAGPGAVVGGEVGAQHLHRDPARQHGVVGDPHGGHPAARERLRRAGSGRRARARGWSVPPSALLPSADDLERHSDDPRPGVGPDDRARRRR